MQEAMLTFFVNLMIWTGGIITFVSLVVVVILISVEIYDFFMEKFFPSKKDDDDYPFNMDL